MKDNFSKSSSPSSRPLKVGEMLRKALAEIFLRGDSSHPVLDGASITVSEVRVSPDLRNATAYVMPLAGSNQEAVIRALADNAPELRHQIAKRVTLRYVPKFYFKLDNSYDEAYRVSELLNRPEVKRDLTQEEDEH